MNREFELYSSMNDLNYLEGKWMYCNYDYKGVGFPRDCGKSNTVGNRWFSMLDIRNLPNIKKGASLAEQNSNTCDELCSTFKSMEDVGAHSDSDTIFQNETNYIE